MNKYLEKIAAKKKQGQLRMRTGQKSIRHPKSKPFIALNAKIGTSSKRGHNG
jgi:hypothetical protein